MHKTLPSLKVLVPIVLRNEKRSKEILELVEQMASRQETLNSMSKRLDAHQQRLDLLCKLMADTTAAVRDTGGFDSSEGCHPERCP